MAIETPQTIAVVGASARAAALSLLRAGHQVVAADLFSDADLALQCSVTRVTPYPTGFAEWLAQTKCDNWIYTGALENYPDLIDQMARVRPLLGHGGEVLRRVRDPLELQAVLKKSGIAFPETRRAADVQNAGEGWIGKTYRGSSGLGVGSPEAEYLQRRVEGVPLSAIYQGEQLLGVTRQLVGESFAGADAFKYCGTIGPWPFPDEQEGQLHALGEVLCERFGLMELYGVDFLLDGDSIWVLEVNPRYTAAVEVIERMCGRSVFAWSHPEKIEGDCCFGKVVLFAKKPMVISKEDSEWLLGQANVENDKYSVGSPLTQPLPGGERSFGVNAWPRLADVPVGGTTIDVGQPVMTLFVEAESCEAVAMTLRERVAGMEQFLYEGKDNAARDC